MIKNFLLQKTDIPLLSKALDVYSIRQKTIASNIANVGTLGYQRKEVAFEEKLQAQLKKHLAGNQTDSRHIPLGSSRIEEVKAEVSLDRSDVLDSGINNVDIDHEIVAQVQNQIRYMYASKLITGGFSGLRASIKGRYDR